MSKLVAGGQEVEIEKSSRKPKKQVVTQSVDRAAETSNADSGSMCSEGPSINRYGAICYRRSGGINQRNFWIILMVMFLGWFVFAFKSFIMHGASKVGAAKRYADAFKHAVRDIRQCEKTGVLSPLYGVFVTLFATRCKATGGHVSERFIEQKLREVGWSDTEIHNWNEFFSRVSAFVFFAGKSSKDGCKELAEEAIDWVNKLEQVL